MKKWCLLFCLIFVTGAISVFGQAKKKVLIYDGRPEEEIASTATDDDSKFIEKEVRKKESAIKAKSKLECDEDTFGVLNVVDGSFTGAKRAQRAFLYELCRSGRSFGIGGIVIVEGGKTVAHYTYGDNGLHGDIDVLPDINQNGLNELVLIGWGTGQGYVSGAIEIVELAASGVKSLGFADIYSDDFGANENGTATAYAISAQKGKTPIYFRETYTQKNAEADWVLTKKSQKFSLRKDYTKYNKIS